MKFLGDGSIQSVAFAVSTALTKSGLTAVLSGGGAASVYAPAAYTSHDLDFILSFGSGSAGRAALLEAGFDQSPTRGIFVSVETPVTVELLPGPVAVGDELVTRFKTLHRGDQSLRILREEDCLKDRLAAAIHWNDLQSARQAAMVSLCFDCDLQEVEAWCRKEGGSQIFDLFMKFRNSGPRVLSPP